MKNTTLKTLKWTETPICSAEHDGLYIKWYTYLLFTSDTSELNTYYILSSREASVVRDSSYYGTHYSTRHNLTKYILYKLHDVYGLSRLSRTHVWARRFDAWKADEVSCANATFLDGLELCIRTLQRSVGSFGRMIIILYIYAAASVHCSETHDLVFYGHIIFIIIAYHIVRSIALCAARLGRRRPSCALENSWTRCVREPPLLQCARLLSWAAYA